MSDRIEELLERAERADEAHAREMATLPGPADNSRTYREWMQERRARLTALTMEAAGYRAEALVLQLRGDGIVGPPPPVCDAVCGPRDAEWRCELDYGHAGPHALR